MLYIPCINYRFQAFPVSIHVHINSCGGNWLVPLRLTFELPTCLSFSPPTISLAQAYRNTPAYFTRSDYSTQLLDSALIIRFHLFSFHLAVCVWETSPRPNSQTDTACRALLS